MSVNFPGLAELFRSGQLKGPLPNTTWTSFPIWRAYKDLELSDTITSNKRSDYVDGWSIIVDIDGCLANWNDKFFDLLQSLHGLPHPGYGRPGFATWDWPKKECGYTNKQIDAAWDQVGSRWWRTLDPYPGAENALKRLNWLNNSGTAQVTFCTGRYPNSRDASTLWLIDHGYEYPHVVHTSKKTCIAEGLAANGPVAVIEDKPTLIKAYNQCDAVNIVCTIDQPYNRSEMGYRFPSADEAVKFLENEINLRVKTKTPAKAEAHLGAVCE